jgi:thioesterase domain-containing protein/acyl carrier protein
MLPAGFVSVEAIPLTPNGKVDRRVLEQTAVTIESSQEYVAPRNETEQQLVTIWAQVLRIAPETIGVNDSFFELGGHSLLAVQLMAKINQQTNQALPLGILFTAPNIAALTQVILNQQGISFDILVPIQPQGDELPIFAIPGVGGNVLSMQPLGQALGKDQPLYGLQAVGLDGKTKPFETVEATAKANIEALKTIQKSGPYSLIGHSYGGVIAYEMVKQLLAKGDTISSLILLDSFAPSVMQAQAVHDDEVIILLELYASLTKLFNVDSMLNSDSLRSISDDKRSEYISTRLTEQGLDINKAQFTTFYDVFKANQRCYRDYKATELSENIKVSLYRAVIKEANSVVSLDDYGWGQLMNNSIDIYDIKADHFSILNRANIDGVTKTIDTVIKRKKAKSSKILA